MALTSVAVVVLDPVSLFEFGVAAEVFGIDRSENGVPRFDFRVCGREPGVPLAGKHTDAVAVVPSHGLDSLPGADLVIVSATSARQVTDDVIEALGAAHRGGAIMMSLCSGAFVLAAAGLLDHRRCTTHWMYADELAGRYPNITVIPDELYVDEGDVVTAAGTASSIDACLHLIRRELGYQHANTIARRLVVPPHRDGGQQQYVDRPLPPIAANGLAATMEWLLENLGTPVSVKQMASHARISPRQFARRFRAEVGVSPHRWLTMQRIREATALLEASELPIERIARVVGYSNAVQLRHHFRDHTGVSPARYRQTFAHADGGRGVSVERSARGSTLHV